MGGGALPFDEGRGVEGPRRVRHPGVGEEHDDIVIAVGEPESFLAAGDVHGDEPSAGRGRSVDHNRGSSHTSSVAPGAPARIRFGLGRAQGLPGSRVVAGGRTQKV